CVSCCSRYFRRAVNVVVRNECRRFNNLRGDQRAEGHHSTCAVTHVILANFSDVLSERSVCLRHYSEVTSIEVEVVYITAAQVTRKRRIRIGDRHTKLFCLFPIEVNLIRWCSRSEERVCLSNLGTLVGGSNEFLQCAFKSLDVVRARRLLQLE